MRPPDDVKKDLVRLWIAKAAQDIHAGETLLAAKPPSLYPACFHAQQAAEKYLKALLTWHQIEFPKTHAVELLLDLVTKVEAETAAHLRDAVVLTAYGVEIRYPGDQPEPNLEDAREAVALARQVRDAVMACLRGV